jgi:hypothetical protein
MPASSLGHDVYSGPEKPWEAVGEVVQLNDGLVSQDYEDGTMIQISARVGEPVVVHPIPEGGLWSAVFEDDGTAYVSIWYPRET